MNSGVVLQQSQLGESYSVEANNGLLREGDALQIDPNIDLANLPPGVAAGDFHGIPNGPPPGLVRVTPPIPVDPNWEPPHRVITEGDLPMFSQLVPFLEGFDILDGSCVTLDLTCQICCARKLDVPTRVEPRQTIREYQTPEPITVLPCGHYFGSRCLQEWLRTREEQDLEPECPYCRFSLIHYSCGHDIKLRQYDPRFPREGQTPLTIPEGGAVSNDCASCVREHLKTMIYQIVYRVYPDVPPGVFIDPNKDNPDTYDELRGRMWDGIMDSYAWSRSKLECWGE